jgi:hypothetical protein
VSTETSCAVMQHSSHINISLQIFFSIDRSMRKNLYEKYCVGTVFYSGERGKTVVPGNGGCGEKNVIYMGLNSGPKMANGEYRKS